jgi:hypothetical protein
MVESPQPNDEEAVQTPEALGCSHGNGYAIFTKFREMQR